MEGSSIVSRARTAFHSAAAKAERVFTDIKKSDLTTNRDSDEHSPNTTSKPEPPTPSDHAELKSYHEVKHLRWKPAPIKTKPDWQERLKKIRIGKKGIEDTEKAENSTMAFAIFDENLYMMNMRATSESKGSEMGSSAEDVNPRNMGAIPPTTVIKQLAIDVEAGKKFKSMKDLLASSRDSSPVRERASLSFSAVKSLVLRDKEEKLEFGADEKVLSVINSLLEAGFNAYFGDLLKIFAEGHFPERKIDSCPETPTNMTSLPKDIHGAPPGSFVVKLSEAIGTFRTLKKVAFFWFRVVAELRRLWSEGQYVSGIPPDEIPDLNSCLLYQQLQVINCCVSRKRRRSIATESLDSVISHANSNVEESAVSEGMVPASPIFYASISSGELVLRLGADKQFDNLTMLETGEPVYTPVMQEGPLLTEDLIKETEEFVLRTGSVGAGCSQLLSDMQAFKAANPGCILEDFVRWHSPPDWMETEMTNEAEDTVDSSDLLSTRGQLSSRMQKEGNLWRELWETAKPVPAVKQAPLFDEDLAVEGILNILEDIPPSELLEQLFVSLLGSGFVLAEASLHTDGSLSKLFYECKDYIVTTFQGSIWRERVDDICQVYETVETMLLNPDEVLKMLKQPEESATAGEPKRRFKRLSLIFGGKNWQSGKNQNNSEENSLRSPFSSIFSKKPPKPDSASQAEKPSCSVENDWTFVYKM